MTKNNEGEYSCVVTDGIGNVKTSRSVKLNVRSNSSSGSSKKSSTTTTSNDSGVTANNNSATNIPSIKPVVVTNITKEQAKLISNVSTVLGDGVTVEQTKEVMTSGGTKLSITPIVKSGKNIGAVITAQSSSSSTTIPVDKDVAVTAVYKYVPLLDKYIKLSQGVVIGTDTITLPTQANATYVASTSEISAMETVTQGWTKVANNWYMVNGTGDPQIGWQKDSVGWVYLSPTNGVMKTGWIKNAGKWYYLKSNGYMAANTTIGRYKLESNGAWIG